MSDVFLSESGKPMLVIASPVKNGSAVAGVLYGVVNVTYFTEKFIEPIKIGESGYVFLFNRDGHGHFPPGQVKDHEIQHEERGVWPAHG